MYCSRCGSSVAEGATFCGACGTPTGAGSAPAAVPAGVSGVAIPSGVGYAAAPVAFAPAYPYAGFWLRFVAYIIDSIILGIGIGVPVIAMVLASGLPSKLSVNADQSPEAILAVIFSGVILTAILFAIVASWLYFAYCQSSTWQATIGKKALGLIVTDLDGKRLSFGRATGRFFAKIVTGLIPLYIGYIMAGFTARKQALHDFIVGTLVLRKT
ncbi:MAG: RDD family protein [Candidatus Acidiferrales bacterium]